LDEARMNLQDLGFDRWFEERRAASPRKGLACARVTAVDRDGFLVRNERAEIWAEAAGRLLFEAESGLDLPCVGDWVFVDLYDGGTLAIIQDILPRRTLLRRKTAGKRVEDQAIAANVDVAFIVQGCDSDFNLRRLERYLVMVHEAGVKPVLLLTKSDLVGPEGVEERVAAVRRSHFDGEVVTLSPLTGLGVDRVRGRLERGKTHVLLGSSGVGKTTLINHLLGRDLFETKAVRERDGKGRHATSRRQMVILDRGALLIDTPGLRELGHIGAEAGIETSFADIQDLAPLCRFGDCSHTTESGCAVLAAVESGAVPRERYQNYLKIRRESEYHQMSYVEKRAKDRAFGRYVKSALKRVKKG
jgi:ribosome biogenesis GTPase